MRKTRPNRACPSAVILLALLLASCSIAAMADGLQAWLDRTQIGEGQSVKLYLMAQADAAGQPDLSPLRRDFDISNIEQYMQMQVLNGRPTNTRTWQLTLMPKQPGKLSVPSLRMGQATSAPLVLEVFPAAQVPANRVLRDVMLQTDVSQQRPYVQGKVIYTVRLYTRLDLHQVGFTQPEVSNTLVERLGADTKYNTYFGRYRYHVLQRRFALFPQRSGRLSIISPLLNAQVREKKSQWPLQLRGPEITLDVQPQPDPTLNPWLPAESLSLSETWSPDPPGFRVGEPVKRSITITAQGVAAAQLPDIPQATPEEINLYPERPVSTSQASGNTLLTTKVFNYALVARHAGNYRLPEVSLSWWDATTGERKTEVLAARDIVVLPGTEPVEDGPQMAHDRFLPDIEFDIDLGAWWQSVRKAWDASSKFWPWLALSFALLGLMGIFAWWRRRQTHDAVLARTPATSVKSGDDALRRFEHACKEKDPHRAREALIDWATATWPNDPPRRLGQLAQRLPPQGAEYLEGIDRALYAPTGDTWDGLSALAALQPLLQDAAKGQENKQDTQALPPLYPG